MITPLRLRAILFDCFNTLIQTEKFDYDTCLVELHDSFLRDGIFVSFQAFREQYFQTRDRRYTATEATHEETHLLIRLSDTLQQFGYILSAADERLVRAANVFSATLVGQMLMNEAVPCVLQQLSADYTLAVVSNDPYPPNVTKTLKRFDIAKFFDVITISGDVGWRKPSPRIFETTLASLHVDSAEAVFVGDSPFHDIEGATTVGLRTVLVTTPSTGATDARKPDAVITKLDELLVILETL